MELLGIGLFELMLIFIIALVVLGPDEMVRVGALAGKFLRNIRQSEVWLGFQRMTRAIRSLSEDMAREAGVDELRREMQTLAPPSVKRDRPQKGQTADLSAWTKIPERFAGNLSLPLADDDRQQNDTQETQEP